MHTAEDDFVEHLLVTSTHDNVLFFTNKGKVYQAKGYEIPEFGRTAKGLPIINLLELDKDEWINAMIPIENEFDNELYLVFATKQGIAKRSPLSAFAHIRNNGLIAIHLREGDELISVKLTDGKKHLIIGTKRGMLIRFPETDVRTMGRSATGVKAISLDDGDEVVGMEILEDYHDVLVVTKKGFGKRTPASEYRVQSRGGKGLKTCNVTERNGPVVAVTTVVGNEDLMVITTGGVLIRIAVSDISRTGRIAQGVKLIRLSDEDEHECVATVAKVPEEEKEEKEEEGPPA